MADNTPNARALFQAAGVSGLNRFQIGGPQNAGSGTTGYIYEEWEPQLRGARGMRVWREMRDSDPVIGGILFACEMLIRQVSWHVKPADESAQAAQVAEFLDGCLHDMEVTWPDTIAEMLSFLTYGWALHEVMYKTRTGADTDNPIRHSRFTDGKLGWRSFAARGQESLNRWEYDEFDRVVGMWQLGPPDYLYHYIPFDKALLLRTSTYKGNPEGRSILRNAYVSYMAKKHIQAVEGIGVERDLAGLPVAYVPPNILLGATAQDAQALAAIKQLVTNIRRDEQEGIVFPLAFDENGKQIYDLKLLSSGGSRQFDTDKIVQRYDSRIAMSVLADFILLGHETTGTYALGASKLGAFTTALSAWLEVIADTFNDQAFPRLVRLNGWDEALTPTLEHDPIDDADLASLGSYLTVLQSTGLLPKDASLIQHLLEIADLPVPDRDALQAHIDQQEAQQQAALDAQQQQPAPGGKQPPTKKGA